MTSNKILVQYQQSFIKKYTQPHGLRQKNQSEDMDISVYDYIVDAYVWADILECSDKNGVLKCYVTKVFKCNERVAELFRIFSINSYQVMDISQFVSQAYHKTLLHIKKSKAHNTATYITCKTNIFFPSNEHKTI